MPGILLSVAVITFFTFSEFIEIIQMLNVIYCLTSLMEFSAFVYLRKTHSKRVEKT